MRSEPARIISTFGYTGYFPVAPGTFTSFLALLLCVILAPQTVWYVGIFCVITALGYLFSGQMEAIEGEKDPGCIVIDEVSGVMVSFFLVPMTWPVLMIGFFLFRAFDMFKIYPASVIEEKGGAFGIMTDDIIAGVYTNIILQIAIRLVNVF